MLDLIAKTQFVSREEFFFSEEAQDDDIPDDIDDTGKQMILKAESNLELIIDGNVVKEWYEIEIRIGELSYMMAYVQFYKSYVEKHFGDEWDINRFFLVEQINITPTEQKIALRSPMTGGTND